MKAAHSCHGGAPLFSAEKPSSKSAWGEDEIIREADTSFLLPYSRLPITSKNRLRRKVKIAQNKGKRAAFAALLL